MRKRLADFFPVILIVVGLGVLLYPTVSNFLVERNASRVVSNYDAAVASLTDEEYARMLDAAHAYNAKLADLAGCGSADVPVGSEGASMEQLEQEYAELLNLNGDGMMGYLTIPSLDVTMPVYHTTEEPVLQVGAGHIVTSSLPVGGASTHAALSGHRGLPSAKLFTELDKLVEGDRFFVRVLNETCAYEIDQILTVLPHETEALAISSGEDFCTLVTCTPYGINSHRLLVRGHAVPFEEEMEEVVGKTGSFVNIPLPYALLMIALAVIALVLAAMKMRQMRRDALEAAALDAPFDALARSAHASRPPFDASSQGASSRRTALSSDPQGFVPWVDECENAQTCGMFSRENYTKSGRSGSVRGKGGAHAKRRGR